MRRTSSAVFFVAVATVYTLLPGASRADVTVGQTFNTVARHQPLAEILEETVIAVQPGRYLAWPTIAKAQNGDLLVGFSGDRDWHVDPYGKIYTVRSTNGGQTWGEPQLVLDTPLDDRDTGLLTLPDGTMAITFNGSMAFENYEEYQAQAAAITPQERSTWTGTFMRLSYDNGHTWGSYLRMPIATPHGPTPLSDGSMLYVRQAVFNSQDKGQTWDTYTSISTPPDWHSGYAFLSEQHAVEAADGRIVGLSRYRDGDDYRLRQMESFDGGHTWTTPTATELEGYPAHLTRLSNDYLVATYTDRFEPQTQRAAISTDNGETWISDKQIILSNAISQGGGDMGYAASVQQDDGTIWSVYYQVPPGSTDSNPVIMATHWRPLEPALFRDSLENATAGSLPQPVIGQFDNSYLSNNVVSEGSGTNSMGQPHPPASSTGGSQFLVIDRPNGNLGRRNLGVLESPVTEGTARLEVDLMSNQGWLTFGIGSEDGGISVLGVSEMPFAVYISLVDDGSVRVYEGGAGWQTIEGIGHTPGQWQNYIVQYELESSSYTLTAGDTTVSLDLFAEAGMDSFSRADGSYSAEQAPRSVMPTTFFSLTSLPRCRSLHSKATWMATGLSGSMT